jgi:L-fuconolactonase
MRELARHPNIYCKLSGMVTEAHWMYWRTDDFMPYIDHVLECFGPDRCMFGSDWPVCTLAASYGQVKELLDECILTLADEEKEAILGRTAARFYGIKQ